MKIEIDIPRPGFALTLCAAVVFGTLWAKDSGIFTASVLPQPQVIAKDIAAEDHLHEAIEHAASDATGGDVMVEKKAVTQAEETIRQTRSLQEILSQKEEFLRYQLQLLEQERKALGDQIDPELEAQFRDSTKALMALLNDEKQAEQFILSSFREIWQSQGRPSTAAPRSVAFAGFLQWPVNPEGGISAGFHDKEYRKIFPFEHDAIDIRVPQETVIRAPAAGRVIEVKDDEGLGFAYLRIEHEEGIVTLYGHITDALVEEGDYVTAGQKIALSGGMPGTKGAGAFTTGPHLHFRLDIDGVPVDPTEYLPHS